MVKNTTINDQLKKIYEDYINYPNSAPLMKLWRQWSTIKGSMQPIFDPSVIFHAHEAHMTNIKMVKTINKIKYTQHYGHIFDVAVAWAKQNMSWNRNVYQITPMGEDIKTKHTAVLEMSDDVHIKKLEDLLKTQTLA